jgi:glycosyltransferase involved in cell wall biosynthesis
MAPARALLFRPTLGDGGADRVTVTLLEHLDRARFTPTLVLMRRTGPLADRVPADVEVIELGSRRLALAAPALARAIRARAPDVVMCTAAGANIVAVAAHRLARSRARLVLSERSALRRPGRELRDRFVIPLKRRLYPMADLVTAVSDGVARDLRDQLALPADRVRVVHNPLIGDDLQALMAERVDHPWAHDRSRPLVVAVGRLTEVKDYPTMLRAFVELRTRHRARLVVLGQGERLGSLQRLAAELGLVDDLAFVGFDPNPFRWMARATLLVQSSLAEGLPGTLVQSMACGTPVVATDCDHGPREVVRDGVDGFLVAVGDSSALAERAGRLLADDTLRARMSDAAGRAGALYTVAAAMARYEAALDGR